MSSERTVLPTNLVPAPAEPCKIAMSDLFRFLAGLSPDLLRERAALVAENALLRQLLILAERKVVGRVRWAPWERFTIARTTAD